MTIQQRYSRQSRLPEIGQGGQARLCAATVVVRSVGFVQTIENRYVSRAGMQVTVEAEAVDAAVADVADVAALGLRHAPAREVAEGALRALVAIRAVVLEVSSS